MSEDQNATYEMLRVAIEALDKIASPIGSAVKYLPEGQELEPNWRYIVTSPDYIAGLARDALHKITQMQSNGGPGTLPDMVRIHGTRERYWRPGLPQGWYVYFHQEDNRFYMQRGHLAAFGELSRDDILSRSWHVVKEGEE